MQEGSDQAPNRRKNYLVDYLSVKLLILTKKKNPTIFRDNRRIDWATSGYDQLIISVIKAKTTTRSLLFYSVQQNARQHKMTSRVSEGAKQKGEKITLHGKVIFYGVKVEV